MSRFKKEEIVIGDNIVVRVVDIRGDKVLLGIDAPTEIPVHRHEVYLRILWLMLQEGNITEEHYKDEKRRLMSS